MGYNIIMKRHHYIYRLYYNVIQRVDDVYEGVELYQPWRDDRELFFSYVILLGERPKGYSLDRVNNEYGYEPMNLRWADRTTQRNNQPQVRNQPVGKTGFKWVTTCNGRFVGKFKHKGESINVGCFDTPEEAHKEVSQERRRRGLDAL